MKKKKLPLWGVIVLAALYLLFGMGGDIPEAADPVYPNETIQQTQGNIEVLAPDGSFTTKEDVALYIHTYGRLPDNFITKDEARDLGWEGGSLEDYAPGKCIGGDVFRNKEGHLPMGPSYTECDIDTLGASARGAKRIVFSSDGRVYYTSDHYETFVELVRGS